TETIKNKIHKKFKSLQTSWKFETEKYKANSNCAKQLSDAKQLFDTIENNFTLNFFEGALKLQSLEVDLGQILANIEELFN
ncbi:23722_t:CDS:1, partial [Cetraspora pellucida]